MKNGILLAKVETPRWWSGLLVLEMILGLTPASMLLGAGFFSYAELLLSAPALLLQRGPAAAILLAGGVMLAGGTLGMAAILITFQAQSRPGKPLRARAVCLLGCAGLVAETLFIHKEGLRHVTSNLFTLWALVGPIVVAVHFLYRTANSSQ